MPTITTKDGTQIYYKDWGAGQPVVFSHGWPLSSDAWEDQMLLISGLEVRVLRGSPLFRKHLASVPVFRLSCYRSEKRRDSYANC